MLLAGVILKLGGYGIVRFLPLLKYIGFFFFFFPFFFYLSMLGSVIISVICFRQMDLKIIIAYSSIVHIGVITLGLIRFNVTSLGGSFLMIVSHGFISPLIFFLINKSYLALNSRSILILKGISLVGSLFCLL
jgi:NADH-ubiquinone oxidoreductase chain 4